MDIAVDKPAPLVGENVTFTVTVANRGPSPATGLVVTDVLSAGLTLVTATPSQGTFVGAGLDHRHAERDRPSGHTDDRRDRHCARPRWSMPRSSRSRRKGIRIRSTTAPASTLNAAESANLKVIKTLTRSSPHVGELLTFNVIVANQGPSPATGVQVTEVLSAGLAFESAAPSQGSYDRGDGPLDGRLDRERRQRGVDDHGARHAGGHGHQHGERHRQRSTGS